VVVWLDALVIKVGEAGRVGNTAALVATGVNACGHREILGPELGAAEDGASWTGFLRGLSRPRPYRGQAGCLRRPPRPLPRHRQRAGRRVLAAVPDPFPCGTCWSGSPGHAQPMVASLVRTSFAPQRPEDAWAQLARVVEQLRAGRCHDAADLLETAAADVLAATAFPGGCWRQSWSNTPQERRNRELRRRTDVVGIFPDRAAAVRLMAAVGAEQHDQWQVTRCSMGAELITASLAIGQLDPTKEATPALASTAASPRSARTTRACCYTT
jgi:putative transposase